MLITTETLGRWLRGKVNGPVSMMDTTRLATDSRQVKEGDFFVALRGPRFDGHAFVAAAFEAGAVAALVDRADALSPDRPGVVVRDSLAGLADFARAVRSELVDTRWVALTGSNGKTTTREMTARLLRARGTVHTTQGNFNNKVGLPLTVAQTPSGVWAAVLEMGTSEPGEIAYLAGIVRPSVAVVTGVGPSHLAGLGDEGGVAREKAAIFASLPEGGLGVYPARDNYAGLLREHIPARARAASFAVATGQDPDPPADMVARDVKMTAEGMRFTVEGHAFRIHHFGRHNVANALAALLTARYCGLEPEEASEALLSLEPVGGRLKPRRTSSLTVIDDTYNANPASLEAAAEVLAGLPVERRVMIVGDMLELGHESRRRHRRAGRALGARGFDAILAVGRESMALAEGADGAHARTMVAHFSSVRGLISHLGRYIQPGDLVLVKGSRGMRMDLVVDALNHWNP